MQQIIEFVSSSIASGVIGSIAYDGLKNILGSSFYKLSNYISNNETVKLEGALEILLEDKALVKKIEALMEGKMIDNSFKGLENSEIDIDLGKGATVTDSFKDNKNSSVKIK